LFGERFLLIQFDQVVQSPSTEIERLLDFAEIQMPASGIDEMAALVHTPSSVGRFRDFDRSVFRPEQLTAVRSLGFVVD
jgi:hypothetical protein